MAKYPEQRSRVTVEYVDGQIRHYEIDAGPGIAGYLADELRSGVLRLSDRSSGKAVVIPKEQVFNFVIELIDDDEGEPCAQPHVSNAKAEPDSIDSPITNLELSQRTITVLHRDNVITIRSLLCYDIRRLNHAKGAGVKVKREVQDMIEELQRVYGS